MDNLDREGSSRVGDAATLGAVLDESLVDAIVLRNRHKPGRKAIVDYIVVAPSGIWVIDAKLRPGLVGIHVDESSGAAVELLHVGGYDRTRDVDGMSWQYEVVARAVDTSRFGEVPVVPLLCYVQSDWGGISEALVVCRIRVAWPAEIARIIAAAPTVIDAAQVEAVAADLDAHLGTADPNSVGPPR